jgi:hypothetical protein
MAAERTALRLRVESPYLLLTRIPRFDAARPARVSTAARSPTSGRGRSCASSDHPDTGHPASARFPRRVEPRTTAQSSSRDGRGARPVTWPSPMGQCFGGCGMLRTTWARNSPRKMFGMVQHPASPAHAQIATWLGYQGYPQRGFGGLRCLTANKRPHLREHPHPPGAQPITSVTGTPQTSGRG